MKEKRLEVEIQIVLINETSSASLVLKQQLRIVLMLLVYHPQQVPVVHVVFAALLARGTLLVDFIIGRFKLLEHLLELIVLLFL